MKLTFYSILRVERDAAAEQIQSAYEKRLRELESAPQRDTNAIMFVREAFRTLSDPAQRANYDASLNSGHKPSASRRPSVTVEEEAPSHTWKIALGVALIVGAGVWWKSRPATTPAPVPGKAQERAIVVGPTQVLASGPGVARQASAPLAPSARPTAGAERSAEQVFAEVSPSVARVQVSDRAGRPARIGSGVVIDRGTVITNCHVTSGGGAISVKVGAQNYAASVDVADEQYDLCRLSVTGLDAPAVNVGSAQALKTGQRVYAIGAPQGLELTISEGIVSALREVPGGTVIQTTAPISQGSSGGGLFDGNGHLVGIVTFQHRYGQNLNFAVPADWLADMRTRGGSSPVASLSTRPSSPAITPVPAPRSASQGPSQAAVEGCRELAVDTARLIQRARNSNIAPGSMIRQEAADWIRGVQHYMAQAADTSRHITEAELAQLGYSYCIQRRPSGA